MKKTYLTPDAKLLALETEVIIAASPNIDIIDDESLEAGESFSRGKGGWDCSNWSDNSGMDAE